jgi:hypothetical protein
MLFKIFRNYRLLSGVQKYGDFRHFQEKKLEKFDFQFSNFLPSFKTITELLNNLTKTELPYIS